MKDPKDNFAKKNVSNQRQDTATVTTKKDLRSLSMEELVKLAKEKNIPVKLDMNKETLIKSLETISR